MKLNFYFFSVTILFESLVLKHRIQKEFSTYTRVHAIKLHRELTGSNLKEAVDYVNANCK